MSNTIAKLYTPTSSSPLVCVRGVVNVPSTLDFTNPLKSPLTIYDGDIPLPTQVEPCMIIDGVVKTAEVMAIAGSRKDSNYSKPFEVKVEDSVVQPEYHTPTVIAATGGMKIRVVASEDTGEEEELINEYSTSIAADAEGLYVGGVRARDHFRAWIMPQDEECVLPHFGILEGFITAYNKLPIIEVDMLWHTGEGTDPIGDALFNSLTIDVPDGYVLVSKSVSPITEGYTEEKKGRGRGTVNLVKTSETGHTIHSQSGKVIRFFLIHEAFKMFAPHWKQNSGQAQSIEQVGETDVVRMPTLSGFPMPLDLGESSSAVSEAGYYALADMQETLINRSTGSSDMLSTEPAGPSILSDQPGFRYPIGSKYGGMTGGQGIRHEPFSDYIAARHAPILDRYLWEIIDGLHDRQFYFLTWQGVPFEYLQWRTLEPSAQFNYVISAGNGSRVWTRKTEDPLGFLSAPSNSVSTVKIIHGKIDTQHAIRFVGALQRQVELFNDPLAKLLLRHAAANQRTEEPAPHVRANVASLGSKMTRAHGWAAHTQALDVAFNSSFEAKAWLELFADVAKKTQLPAGGLLAWDHNKEASQALKEAKANGVDVEKIAVTQSYQEIIVPWGLYLARIVGVGDLEVIKDAINNVIDNLRSPEYPVPHYRIGVYKETSGGNPIPESVIGSYADAAALYVSNQTSEWHYPVALAMSLTMAEPTEIAKIKEAIYALSLHTDTLQMLDSHRKYYYNAEALTAALRLGKASGMWP